MTSRTFDKLCGLMSGLEAGGCDPMRIAIVLYKLASCFEYRIVANLFGVHKSTVKKFVYVFCKGMVSLVMKNIIRMPTAEEAIAIASRFQQKFHIPQIIGCIDGTHIPILPPSDGYWRLCQSQRMAFVCPPLWWTTRIITFATYPSP